MKPAYRSLGMTILILALIPFAILFFFYWFERFNVWIPHRTLVTTPESQGLAYEDVWLTTEDGITIHAWYVPHPQALAAMVVCHGNAGNISHRVQSLRQWHEMGLSVLIFDYRGYGQSEGWLSEEGTYLDAITAVEWLRQREPDLPLVLHGRSLGAAVATEAAVITRPDGLIFESGFTSVPDLGSELFPILPVRWLSRISYDNKSRISEVTCPVLVIHAEGDRIVPARHGRTIHEHANDPRRFVSLSGGHNDAFYMDGQRYHDAIVSFVTEVVVPGRGG